VPFAVNWFFSCLIVAALISSPGTASALMTVFTHASDFNYMVMMVMVRMLMLRLMIMAAAAFIYK
jgi:hypothetical protein